MKSQVRRRTHIKIPGSIFVLACVWLSVNFSAAGSGTTNEILYLSGTDRDHTVPWEFCVSADGDGLKLLLENAFALSPFVADASSPRLPHLVVPGVNTPAGLGYRVPLTQTDEFRFVPEISDDLQTWFDADTHPDYFLITSGLTGDEQQFTVERGAGWPGSDRQIFIRLRIERK